MNRVPAWRVIPWVLVSLFVTALQAQDGPYVISPVSATVLTGESRHFMLLDCVGRIHENVLWSISPGPANGIREGDGFNVTATEPGEFRISVKGVAAEATLKVIAGSSFPIGTVMWSVPPSYMCVPGSEEPIVPAAALPAPPKLLSLNATSICDRLTIGMEQAKVRGALRERGLSFSEEGPKAMVWLVEEPATHCRLWFDEKAALIRKRKILVAE